MAKAIKTRRINTWTLTLRKTSIGQFRVRIEGTKSVKVHDFKCKPSAVQYMHSETKRLAKYELEQGR